MEVIMAQVCGGDGYPPPSTGTLEPCAQTRHTVSSNQQDFQHFNEFKHFCLSEWIGEVGLASPQYECEPEQSLRSRSPAV